MGSDDHDERLGGALPVALVSFLIYKKRRRAKTLAEWALILRETADVEENEGGDGPRVKRTRQVHQRSDFSRSSVKLRKPELKQRDFREHRTLCRYFCIPYEFFLEHVQLEKHQTWFSLAARDVAGGVVHTCSAEGQ